MSSLPAFTPNGDTASLSAATASSNVALARKGGNQILIQNAGTSTAYIDWGTTAVTATTTDTPIPAGAAYVFTISDDVTNVAAITATGTASLTFTPGNGEFQGALGGPSTGGGGAGSSSVISTENSTATPLAGAGVFTGTSVDVTQYGSITVSGIASHASATNGLSIQQSADNVNWDFTDTYSVAAATSFKINVPRQARYFRLVYTNGATLQTSFRLQTILNPMMPRAVSVKPVDGMTVENDMDQAISVQTTYNGTSLDLQRSIIAALNSTGTGIMSAGVVAQLDDVSTATVTENQFAPLRMSTDRMLLVKANPYPNLATPLINASANQANAAAAATLTGTATTTVYMSGFEVTGSGATAGLPVAVTVAGILGGTRTYIYTFATGALLGNTPLIVAFNPPLPAAAVNTPIVVTCPASGAGGLNNTVVAHGYYQ